MASTVWKRVNLSPSHAYLLMMVLDEPNIQPGALAKELLLTPSTITRLIDKLVEKKLVRRIADGKTINVYPTPKGKSLQPQLKRCSDEFYENYTSRLGRDESDKLAQVLNKITDKI